MILEDRKMYQSMPPCIEVFEGVCGLSVRSTKHIPKGSVIDGDVSFCFIDNSDDLYELYLNGSDSCVPLHSYTNTLLYTTTERVCNGYIGYLNHSCADSNIRFKTSNQFGFAVVATRDISAKEELTSNYLLFDYTCDGHAFTCACGLPSCYGSIRGFNNLSFDVQCTLIDEVTGNVLQKFSNDRYDAAALKLKYEIDGLEGSFSCTAGKRKDRSVGTISEDMVSRIHAIAQNAGVSEGVVYMALYVVLLDKITGTKSLSLYRSDKDTLHVNDIEGYGTVLELCHSITGQLSGPPIRVLKHLLNMKDVNAAHVFSYSPVLPQDGLDSKSDLELSVCENRVLRWRYSSKYDDGTVASLEKGYIMLLNQLTNDDTVRICDLIIMEETDRNIQLYQWNNTLKPVTLQYVFETVALHAVTNPDKVALECGSHQLSYLEFVDQMNVIASILQGFGVKPEDVCGVMLPRNCQIVVSLFAILKSGGAYTALLYDFPTTRLQYILEYDCQSKFVVTISAYAHKFKWFKGQLIFVDKLEEYRSKQVEWVNQLKFSNLAYVTYTSGSTGSPKGILVEHEQLILYTLQKTYNLDVDKYLHSTNITFDIIAMEVYIPLVHNKCVVIVESLLSTDIPEVGFIQGASSLLENTHYQGSGDVVVSQIGEKISAQVLEKFGTVINGYGTAETVNISVCKWVKAGDDISVVGKPHNFSFIYILGPDMSVLPPNVRGEIYIGGPSIARGYLNQGDLTSEKFVLNPFEVGRMYRTGDFGMWTTEGEVRLLGRGDSQIKINGVRVELGEIEHTIQLCEGVERVIVQHVAKTRTLLVYYMGDCSEANVEIHCRKYLPPVMIPNCIVHVSDFPLGSNGKVDKSALPLPQRDTSVIKSPVSSDEFKMCDLWNEVLHLPIVSTTDRFFQLGGDSLKLVQLLYAVKRSFGISLKVSDIYVHDSVASLVEFMNSDGTAAECMEASVLNPNVPSTSICTGENICYMSYYQMHQVLWYDIQTSIKISFRSSALNLSNVANALARKFPILKARIKTGSWDSTPLNVADLCDVSRCEIVDNDQYDVTAYVEDEDLPVHRVDVHRQFSECCVISSENAIVLTLSHLIYDGYSLDRMFVFLDELSRMHASNPGALSVCDFKVDNYRHVNAEVDKSIVECYEKDIAYWSTYFSHRVVGSRRKPVAAGSLPLSSSLQNLSVFEIIKVLNDSLEFDVLFHLETTTLRQDSLNYFQNGCLLCVEKHSSVESIEMKFRENLLHSTVPIYLLINKFDLKNMVFLNHAVMKYDKYTDIRVEYGESLEAEENNRGHYPVSVVHFGSDSIHIGIQDSCYV